MRAFAWGGKGMKGRAESILLKSVFHAPFPILTALSFLLAICIAQLDAMVGPSVSLAALYVLPLVVAAWCAGVVSGLWLALLCSVLPGLIEEPGTVWLSYLVRFTSLACLAWITGTCRGASLHMQDALKRSSVTLRRERLAGDKTACAFGAFLNNSPNLFCICDHELRIQVIGASWLRHGGDADAVGRKLLDFLHPDDVGPAALAFHERGHAAQRFRGRVRADGEACALRFSIRHCRDSGLFLVYARELSSKSR